MKNEIDVAVRSVRVLVDGVRAMRTAAAADPPGWREQIRPALVPLLTELHSELTALLLELGRTREPITLHTPTAKPS